MLHAYSSLTEGLRQSTWCRGMARIGNHISAYVVRGTPVIQFQDVLFGFLELKIVSEIPQEQVKKMLKLAKTRPCTTTEHLERLKIKLKKPPEYRQQRAKLDVILQSIRTESDPLKIEQLEKQITEISEELSRLLPKTTAESIYPTAFPSGKFETSNCLV